jgi:hypothetical protein
MCPNCKAVGELLSEIFDSEQTDSYIFIYIDSNVTEPEKQPLPSDGPVGYSRWGHVTRFASAARNSSGNLETRML